MPQYEYANDVDDEVIVLLRPMRDADAPVEDPSGRGRVFRRQHSVFGVAGSPVGAAPVHSGPCCPCGKPKDRCGGG
ncbi:MAG: hypothetical protein ACKORL_05160 [Phycisphaerales bacterium]